MKNRAILGIRSPRKGSGYEEAVQIRKFQIGAFSGSLLDPHIYRPATGYIYLIGAGLGHVEFFKIGFTSTCPALRVRTMTGSPLPLSLIGYTLGSIECESELHTVFERWATRGEWFRAVPNNQWVPDAILDAEAANG